MNFRYLTEFLDTIPTFGAPGVDCIIQKDGETVYRHMAGLSDRENVTPMLGTERFNLYSATKPITCAAALQLYEQGRYLLTDPVAKYLPEFADMQVAVPDGNGGEKLVPAERLITVKDLFAMTAGLDYDTEIPEIREAQARTGGASPTREIIRALAAHPLYFQPGSTWNYALCHDVLGALIEVWSGERFGTYLEKNIFRPLGMTSTGFSRTQADLDSMMPQYLRDLETGAVTRMEKNIDMDLGPEYESGGAGLISCVDDYIRFVTAMANGGMTESGGRILHPNTIDLMRENQLNEKQMEAYNWVHLAGYGYGLGVRTLISRAASGSPGPAGEFGWAGAAGVYLIIDPENRLSLFYAQHMRNSYEPYIHPRLRNLLYTSI